MICMRIKIVFKLAVYRFYLVNLHRIYKLPQAIERAEKLVPYANQAQLSLSLSSRWDRNFDIW